VARPATSTIACDVSSRRWRPPEAHGPTGSVTRWARAGARLRVRHPDSVASSSSSPAGPGSRIRERARVAVPTRRSRRASSPAASRRSWTSGWRSRCSRRCAARSAVPCRERRARLANDAHGLAPACVDSAAAQPALFDELPTVRVPVLLVAGNSTSASSTRHDLARRLPRASLRDSDAGHAAHLEQPEAFARVARDFLRRRQARRPRLLRYRSRRSLHD